MGFLKRLFKKKPQQKKQSAQQRERQPKEEVTLEDVERELEGIDSMEETEAEETFESEVERDQAAEAAAEASEDEPSEEASAQPTTYHIQKHDEGWQVLADGADEPEKIFKYQKEAIDYAKEKQYEYLVYKADGTLRKK